MIGGDGGYSIFGGAAHGKIRDNPLGANDAVDNSGAGGGGAVDGFGGNSGGGGGAGGFAKVLISSPTSYPFSIGVGGDGGFRGAGERGTNGGSGQILVEEYY
jgi:hypothetical protein